MSLGAALLAVVIAAALAMKPVSDLLAANDRIDLCFDDYSPAYIEDETARVEVCGSP